MCIGCQSLQSRVRSVSSAASVLCLLRVILMLSIHDSLDLSLALYSGIFWQYALIIAVKTNLFVVFWWNQCTILRPSYLSLIMLTLIKCDKILCYSWLTTINKCSKKGWIICMRWMDCIFISKIKQIKNNWSISCERNCFSSINF